MSGVYKRYRQRKGAILWISHDFGTAAREHSTSITSVATSEVSSGLSITGEVTTGDLWSASVGSAATTGRLTFLLSGTFADGNVDVLKFEIVVCD